MYGFVLSLHNILRWAVIIVGIVAIIRGLIGWTGKKPWLPLDNQLSLAFTISLDVQVLLGLLLYGVLSPITTSAFADFGGAMSNSDVRFWLVEHIFVMIVALALAHIGRSRAKKAATDVGKHKLTVIFFGLAYLAIWAGTPWFRPLLPF